MKTPENILQDILKNKEFSTYCDECNEKQFFKNHLEFALMKCTHCLQYVFLCLKCHRDIYALHNNPIYTCNKCSYLLLECDEIFSDVNLEDLSACDLWD